jgi:hypothetical protein
MLGIEKDPLDRIQTSLMRCEKTEICSIPMSSRTGLMDLARERREKERREKAAKKMKGNESFTNNIRLDKHLRGEELRLPPK